MRRGWVSIGAAVLAAALSVVTFAVDAPRAGADQLLGYDLSADARGLNVYTILADGLPVQVPVDLPVALPIGSQIQPEFNLPQASAQQQSGSGYALSSTAWPGAAVANGGALIGLLIPGFPPQVAGLLLYPVRAEARTGQNPPTTNYDIPGLTMRSRADETSAEADAGVQGLSVLPGAFGTVHTTSSVRATDKATSTARSVVSNLNLAGVLEIDGIVSTATASSDGTTASGSASTVITGASVMGQGVTIDQDGIHFAKTTQALDALLQTAAKSALAAAGITATIGPTTKEINGPSAIVGAQSLVITVSNSGYTIGVTLGGARAAASASVGSSDSDTGGDGSDFSGGTDVLGGNDFSGDLSGLGDLGDLGSGNGQAINPGPAVDLVPTVASAKGTGLPVSAVVLGALAALLFAVGMRRLNTAVLADPTAGIACTLPGEDS